MTPFFGITHSLIALLLPHQHSQKVKGVHMSVVGLSLWTSCGDSESHEQCGRAFFPMHQIIIAVLDVFFLHFSSSEESILQEDFPDAKPWSNPLSLPLHCPAVLHNPEHSQQCHAQVLQVRQCSRMTPWETMNFSFAQARCQNSRFPHPKNLRANIRGHPSQ